MAFKGDKFEDRAKTAAAAKAALAERFRAQPGPDDPAALERQAARRAIAEAREIRAAERAVAKAADAARKLEEDVALKAAQAAADVERAKQDEAAAARKIELEAERKAARDARYAARKARR